MIIAVFINVGMQVGTLPVCRSILRSQRSSDREECLDVLWLSEKATTRQSTVLERESESVAQGILVDHYVTDHHGRTEYRS